MRLGALGVEVAAHPSVVNERLRRRLQLHVPVDAAPAVMHPRQAFARGSQVRDFHHHFRRLAGFDDVRDLVLLGGAVVVDVRHLPLVHPHPSGVVDAAELDPDALTRPRGRNLDAAPIPALAHQAVTQGLDVVVPRRVPAHGIAGLAHALRLPAAGHHDLAPVVPELRGLLEHLRPASVAVRLRRVERDELPLSAKRNHCGGILAEERIDHRRMRCPSPPCEFGLDGCRRNCR